MAPDTGRKTRAENTMKIHISATPEHTSAKWFQQTVHDKKTGQSCVYLFQRSDTKSSLGRLISDFVKNIKPASDKVSDELKKYVSSESRLDTSVFSNVKSSAQAGGKHRPLQKSASSSESEKSAPGTQIIIHEGERKTEDVVREKGHWNKTIDAFFKPKGAGSTGEMSSTQRKLNNAIHYAIDLESGVARPTSQSERKAMSEHIHTFLMHTPFEDDSESLSRLQKLYAVLTGPSAPSRPA